MKQALTEALAEYTPNPGITPSDSEKRAELDRYWEQRSTILAAARLVERLLPGECETCAGEGVAPVRLWPARVPVDCPDCHGSGQVWDEGIVEAVAAALDRVERGDGFGTSRTRALLEMYGDKARAVLSALVELLTGRVKS